MHFFKVVVPLAIALTAPAMVNAGPIAYGICQTGMPVLYYLYLASAWIYSWLGCNILAVACYAAAGFTFGTVAAPAAPAAILGCNSALGSCSAACAATALIAPIP